MNQFGGGAPDVSFLGMTVAASASGLAIGPERPDRIVIVAGQKEQDASGAFAVPTINGTAATIIAQPSMSDPIVMGYAFVPTGTTVNIAASGALRVCGWVLINVSALYQTLTGAISGVDCIVTGTMPAQPSAIISFARSRSTESSYSASISGVLKDVVTDAYSTSGSGASSWVMAHAKSDGPGSGTLTMTGSNSYSSGYGAAAVFI